MAIVGPWPISVYKDAVDWVLSHSDRGREARRPDLHVQRREAVRHLLRLRAPPHRLGLREVRDHPGFGRPAPRADRPRCPCGRTCPRSTELLRRHPTTPNSRTRRVGLSRFRTSPTPRRSGRRSETPGPLGRVRRRADRPGVRRRGRASQRSLGGGVKPWPRSAVNQGPPRGDPEETAGPGEGEMAGSTAPRSPLRPALRGLPGTIFVYPLIVQFFISFKDYFFSAPGATVDRPWVGLQNYVDVVQDPTFQRSLFNVFEFLSSMSRNGCALTRAGIRVEYEDPRAVVLPRRLLRARRHGQRGDRDGLAVHVRRAGLSTPSSGGWRPTRRG